MNWSFDTVLDQLQALSPPEVLAVVLAIAYLLLLIRQNIWCWACAAVSSAIYVWLFIVAKLYMESLLYAFYVAMAAYGWWIWQRGGQSKRDLPVQVWPVRVHAIAITAVLVSAAVTGWILAGATDAAYPYVDSLTTYSAIWATFLVARKVLENWWYWLVIDVISIAIYWTRGLELTALLFVIYVALIPVGMLQWRRSYRSQDLTLQ